MIWENKTGEADRVITLLTPSGVVKAYAKNSLRPKNKLTSPTAMLSYSNFEMYTGANMYTVDDAQIKHRFVRLFSDTMGYAVAAYFCELLKLLAPVDDDAGDFMSLALNSFFMLNEGKKEHDLIKCVFELRLASLAGYMPDLVACSGCGASESTSGWFDIQEGIWICSGCARAAGKSLNLPGSSLSAMRHIIYSGLAKALSFELGDESKRLLSQICEQYIIARLERIPATLEFYKTIST